MKTKKMFLAAALLGLFAVSATNPASTIKAVNLNNPEECKQCGVSNATITEYLVNCSHHHTVYSVSDIPGTCNSSAMIESCQMSTVYVTNGVIIGHADSNISCP
jgi:hypothetical protein